MKARERVEQLISQRIPAFKRNYPDTTGNTNYGLYGLSIGPGWLPLILNLCESIERDGLTEKIKIIDIKQKCGQLRIYVSGYENAGLLYDIDDFQKESIHICELCGEPGEINTHGFMATLCSAHKNHSFSTHEKQYEAKWAKQVPVVESWIKDYPQQKEEIEIRKAKECVEELISQRGPAFRRNKDWKEAKTDYDFLGFSFGPGWMPLIFDLCLLLEQLGIVDQADIQKIKQQGGKLRILINFGDDQNRKLYHKEIRKLEEKSAYICELCSEPVEVIHKSTLCSQHTDHSADTNEYMRITKAQWKRQITVVENWLKDSA